MPSPSHQPAPEKLLLIACARTRLTEDVAARIRQISAAPLDWELVLRAAAEHSVLPLLARNLPAAAPDNFSAEQFERLRKAARACGIRSLQLSAELIRVMELFRASGISAYPYKGPLLAAQAYGDLALREFEDLDILLRQRDMPRANEVLAERNYRPRFPWIFSREADGALVPGEYNFSDEARGVIVELHTERTLRHFPVAPDFAEMAKSLATVSLSGHGIETFCAEDMLVLLCIHGTKDFWARLSWIADVSEFIQNQPSLDWERVLRRAQGWKAERMLFLGLELAASVLDAPVPPNILALVQGDRMAGKCAAEIRNRLVVREAAAPGAAASFAYRRHMVRGLLAGWRYALRLAMVPAEEDWVMVQLPAALSPLYFALRPLRLLRKHGTASKTRGGSDEG